MEKYTHLTERCSSFLRTGSAWRLKRHGYTFSGAYWRLREGKGLLSAYDQESLKLWSSLITSVRRCTGPVRKLLSEDQRELNNKREVLLVKMEAYRDWMEAGSRPQYLHDGILPAVMEHILTYYVTGNVRNMKTEEQQIIWESLDIEGIRKEALSCMKDIEIYRKERDDDEQQGKMPALEEWVKRSFNRTFVKDKVWQIRTDMEHRSSVNAGIGERLNFIWDIPTLTDRTHRDIFHKNQSILDAYKLWKEQNLYAKADYAIMMAKVRSVLDSIEIPTIG